MKLLRGLAAALLIGGLSVGTPLVLPAMTVAAEPAEADAVASEPEVQEPTRFDASYVDDRCREQLAVGLPALDGSVSELTAGWYVVREDVQLDAPLSIDGDVRLVLQNGATLTTNQGIRVKKDATLTLYGQRDASGALVVRQGIVRQLTPEQQAAEDARLAAELERDPSYRQEEPQILFVKPCLQVVAGDHGPWPADAADPDPDPEHAPARVDKPVLDADLLGKTYLEIRPLHEHALLLDGDHFVCTACDGWFQDAVEYAPVEKSDSVEVNDQVDEVPEEEPATQEAPLATEDEAKKTVTITFVPNGGSGTMEPMEVIAEESFELPECNFTPPEGKVFDAWSLGRPGSRASVPINTTVKAYWKAASPSTQTNDADSVDNTQQQDETPSRPTVSVPTAQQQSESTTQADKTSPSTGDATLPLQAAINTLVLLGGGFVLAGNVRRG